MKILEIEEIEIENELEIIELKNEEEEIEIIEEMESMSMKPEIYEEELREIIAPMIPKVKDWKDWKNPSKKELKELLKETISEDDIVDKVIKKLPKDEQPEIDVGEDRWGQYIKKDWKKMYIKSGWMPVAWWVHDFILLRDTPDSYDWQAWKVVKVKADASWLEFWTDSDAQDLQSVTDIGNVTTNSIEASAFVTTWGTSSDFVKGDGSLDSRQYLTAQDLSSTVTLYPTTASSDIGGYYTLVSDISDPSYDEPAVDVPTWAISWTDQLIASLASAPWIIVGTPWVVNLTIIGNIRKVTWATSTNATFHFHLFKRDYLGTETEIWVSNNTLTVTNAIYEEFSASLLFNDWTWIASDRVVLKFYWDKVGSWVDPTYEFQFGGETPVRVILPLPVNVLLSNYALKTSVPIFTYFV